MPRSQAKSISLWCQRFGMEPAIAHFQSGVVDRPISRANFVGLPNFAMIPSTGVISARCVSISGNSNGEIEMPWSPAKSMSVWCHLFGIFPAIAQFLTVVLDRPISRANFVLPPNFSMIHSTGFNPAGGFSANENSVGESEMPCSQARSISGWRHCLGIDAVTAHALTQLPDRPISLPKLA